ncbi:GerMN domain-containing protein [Blastococcus sp. TF02-09]|uniref:GerMN domain-containing protein n=1 Tax=Blastococcus sp. TF02-09 TaxID=2250576 RepID=UPI0013145083|nr:GerMN domain-containing protein [Blastococcus sp. TF02-9]
MTRRAVPVLLAALAVLAGCGVPTGGEPSTIAASDVPYGLAEPAPSSAPSSPPDAVVDASLVHWVSASDSLVPRVREVSGTTRRARLADLLEQLADGPTGAERDEQLSTALPPEVRLSVTGVDGGTATIDLDAPAEAPVGVSGRLAVAQIVLTATSVPGVDAVLLQLAGEPIEAPLPDGELTDRPLTAADYAATAAAPPAPAAAVPAEPPVPAPPS